MEKMDLVDLHLFLGFLFVYLCCFAFYLRIEEKFGD